MKGLEMSPEMETPKDNDPASKQPSYQELYAKANAKFAPVTDPEQAHEIAIAVDTEMTNAAKLDAKAAGHDKKVQAIREQGGAGLAGPMLNSYHENRGQGQREQAARERLKALDTEKEIRGINTPDSQT